MTKRPYFDFKTAQERARDLINRGVEVVPYHCKYGNHYHVGHDRRMPLK